MSSVKRKLKKTTSLLLCLILLAGLAAFTGVPASAAEKISHTELARMAGGEGIVLLENDGVLPLEGDTVALFGINQIDYVRGGGGSGATNVDYQVTLAQGLQNKSAAGKISLYEPLVSFYQAAYNNGSRNANEPTMDDATFNAAKAAADTAVITIGRYSWEGDDRSSGAGDYMLSASEQALVTRVCDAGFDKVIVVFNIGGIVDSSWFKDNDKIDAVVVGWQGGMEGGNAIADVLTGDVNPSGKLTDTWAKAYSDYPGAATFKESSAYVNYKEDIYVGYRYFETIPGKAERVNYEFGYGLSYTTFSISDIRVSIEDDNVVTTAKVTNTGSRPGKEVVQVYYSAPQGLLGKPARELGGYAKTDELAPDESETVTISFPVSDMASYDDLGAVQKAAYLLEKGDYKFYVGNSVRNVTQSTTVYSLSDNVITEQLTTRMPPEQLTERLLADGTYQELSLHEDFVPYHTIAASGVTKVQNEAYIAGDTSLRVERFYEPNFEMGRCLAYLNAVGRWVEYDLTTEAAGYYYITFRAANGYPQIINPFSVFVNGVQQPGVNIVFPQTGQGSANSEWYNFELVSPFMVYLPEGHSTLRFEQNTANGPNLDYMLFEKTEDQPDYIKPVAASGKNTFNAAEYALSSGNIRTETFTKDGQTYTCLAYMNYIDNSVSYYLDVEQAGQYDLVLNMSNGRAAVSDFATVLVDNADQNVSFYCPQTGNGDAGEWYNFQDIPAVTVTMPEGQCVLKFVSKSTAYPNTLTFSLTRKADVEGASSGEVKAAEAARNAVVRAPGGKIVLSDVAQDPSLMDAFLAQLTIEQLANLSQGQPSTGLANTGGMGNLQEYGIPNIMTADGPAGVRLSGMNTTAWPCSTQLASTWNVELETMVGQAICEECNENNISIWLAPGMNIHRDPLCGRNFEYYSEDPLLTGKTAAAVTKGVQSGDVAVALKHYAANNKEQNRSASDSRMSERALREIYLKGYEIAIKEADAWTVMSSYNLINGCETAESYELLTNILREEWGFDGLVMTDWGNNSLHDKEAKAGNDIKMSSGSPSTLLTAVEKGFLTRAELERNIERLMNLIIKTKYTDVFPLDNGTKLKATRNVLEMSATIRGENCGDSDGGKSLGYCDAGTWVSYYVDVKTAGTYEITPRIASNAGAGAFQLLSDGTVLTTFNAVSTGGWQNWTSLAPKTVELEAGLQELRIAFTASGMNFNWLQFKRLGAVEGISLDKSEMHLNVTQQKTLQATFTPDAPLNTNVTWSSDNEAVATVSASGVVTGVAPGTAAITVTTEDGGYTDTCLVTVGGLIRMSVAAGDTVAVPITLENCDRFAGLSYGTIDYDDSLLTLNSVTAKKDFLLLEENGRFVVITSNPDGVSGDVVVGYAVFTAKAELDDDVTAYVTFPLDDVIAFDADINPIAVTASTVEIAIEGIPPLRGDVNLDSKVDVADAILLLQYLAGISELNNKQLKAADTNNDGLVNVGDVVIIMQMCL